MDTVCGASPLDERTPGCPVCGKPGKKMRPETIRSIVKKESVPVGKEGFSLCLTRDCDVVYFGSQIYYKPEVKVKVWFKEENDPMVPVCYCKNVSREEIYNHIVIQKCCSDLQSIQEHTGANTGRECLTRNPAGI